MLVVPIRNLSGCGNPDFFMRADVADSLVKIFEPERQSYVGGVNGQSHDKPATRGRCRIESVELITNGLFILWPGEERPRNQPLVINAVVVRHSQHATTGHSHGKWLIVAAPIANVIEAFRSQ